MISVSHLIITAKSNDARIYFGGFIVYLAVGLPIAFFYYAYPAILRQNQMDSTLISLIALVYLPLALRGIWAPLIDWVAQSQPMRHLYLCWLFCLFMAGCLIILPILDPVTDFYLCLITAICLFICAASAMTAFSGYALAQIQTEKRKYLISYQGIGIALSGLCLGLGLMLTENHAWISQTSSLAAVTFIIIFIFSYLTRQISIQPLLPLNPDVKNQFQLSHLKDFFFQKQIAHRLSLSILLHGSLGLILGYLPILQIDAGLSLSQIGLFGVIGTNLIGILGTCLALYTLRYIQNWTALSLQAICTALIFMLFGSMTDKWMGPLYAISLNCLMFLLIYIFYTLYKNLVLVICEGAYAATQAAILISIDLVIGILASSIAGYAATLLDFSFFLYLCAGLSLLAAMISFPIKQRYQSM